MNAVFYWILHLIGVDDATGPWYLFWSGFGAQISNLAILTGLVALYRRHICGIQGCWRLGHKNVPGKDIVVCHKHFGAAKPSAEEIALHLKSQSGPIITNNNQTDIK